MPEITHQFDVQITEAFLFGNDGIDLAKDNLLLNVSLYEDMFSSGLAGSILVKDVTGWSDKFELYGGEDLYLTAQSGEGETINFPIFQVIGVTVDESELVHGKKLVIDFVTANIIENEYKTDHLSLGEPDDPFYGDVSEFAGELIDRYTQGGGTSEPPEIEDTANNLQKMQFQKITPMQ
jgi:hypothetical protein